MNDKSDEKKESKPITNRRRKPRSDRTPRIVNGLSRIQRELLGLQTESDKKRHHNACQEYAHKGIDVHNLNTVRHESDPYMLEIRLEGIPSGPNGAHGHWAAKARMKKEWRQRVCLKAVPFAPMVPLEKAEIECIRYTSHSMDYDNLVASFKALIDGLKDAGIIIDDNQGVLVRRTYTHEKIKNEFKHVKMTVRAV